MRRLLAPLLLVLALAGCGGDDGGDEGDAGGEDGRPDVDLAAACDPLGDDDAAAIAGYPVTRSDQDLPGGGVSCTYSYEEGYGSLNVVVVPEDGSYDALSDLTGDDVELTPIEIPGTEEAVVADDGTGSLALTSLLARGDDVVLTVYPTGLTRDDELRIGRAALTVLLGGELDPADAVDRTRVPHPCDQLTQQEAGEALGVPVTATRSDTDSGSVVLCVYESGGEPSVTLSLRGPDVRVDRAASGTGGTEPEEVTAPAPLTVFASPDADSRSAVLLVATDVAILDLTVEGVDGAEARRLAEALLPALA